jgi:hypothetical protein
VLSIIVEPVPLLQVKILTWHFMSHLELFELFNTRPGSGPMLNDALSGRFRPLKDWPRFAEAR